MKRFLLLKLYTVIAFAILGIRLAFAFLSPIELIQFFVTAIGIGIAGGLLHWYFEHRAVTTGINAKNSTKFLISMIVIVILASGGIYMLLSYIYSRDIRLEFEILFYVLFVPAALLFSLWMNYRIQEEHYNQKLKEFKKKED